MQKQTVTFQKETINRLKKDVEYFKEQTSEVIDNLVEKQDNSRLLKKNIETPDKKYYPKVIPRFARQLLISDSTYCRINQQDISQQTAIHSYSSATIKDIGNVVETYSPGAKTETLVLHAGHNSIDKGLSGQDAAMQMKVTVDKCMKKLKPHRVAVCKFSPVKDVCYGRNSNNEAITKFNEQLEMICLELDGLYPWSKVECLDNALTDNDISYDGVHPNINGIKNLVNNIRHYNVLNNLPAAQNVIQPRKIPNYRNIA